MTFRRDILGEEEIKNGVAALADSIAVRMREEKMKCTVVQVTIKDPQFNTVTRQRKLDHGTYLQKEITDISMELIRENWNMKSPIRMLTVTGADLIPEDQDTVQLSLFGEKRAYEKQEKLEDAMAAVRDKFGNKSIGFGYFDDSEIGVYREK
jgi:DNA polymerase-4